MELLHKMLAAGKKHMHRHDRVWKSMGELPIRSLSWLTNKARQQRLQSKLLQASSVSALSSRTSSSLTKESVSQPRCMGISTPLEGTFCGKQASLTKDWQEDASSCTTSPLEGDDDAERACLLESTKPPETSSQCMITLPEHPNTEGSILQTDGELRKVSPYMPALFERANDVEDIPELECTDLQETLMQILTVLSAVDDTEQGITIKADSDLQETSTQILTNIGVDGTEQRVGSQDDSISSEGEGYVQHILQQSNEEMQEPFARTPSWNKTDSRGYGKLAVQGTVPQDMPSQISSTVKKTEGTDFIAVDMAHCSSKTRNTSIQKISSSISSSDRESDGVTLSQKNVELEGILTRTTVIEMSLPHHMQQDDASKEEASARSFIMNRFLPAAKEVAAEHESSIAAPLVSKNPSEAAAPSVPQQSHETPAAHRVKHPRKPTPSLSHQSQRAPVARSSKSKAQQAFQGFASSHPLQSWHQEDIMPYSVKSCGFFCQELKTALFRAHHAVSVSARSKLRKKPWAPTSLVGCESEGPVAREKAMGVQTKLRSMASTCAPVSPGVGSSNGHAIKHGVSDQFEHMGSMQSRYGDPVMARNSRALKDRDYAENAPEGAAQCSHQGTCECKSSSHGDRVKTSPLPNSLPRETNVSSSTLQDILSGSGISSGKPAALDIAFRSAWQDDNAEDDEEPQFFDALSRLNSLKSSASFYTTGSPRSENEALRFEDLWINDEGSFTDTSSHFESPPADVSKSMSVLLPVCEATEKGMTKKVSTLSQRVGKGLKLEIAGKEAKSPSEHDSPACEVELKQGEWRTESFARLRHPFLESSNGLLSSKESTISPVFPSKCQNSSSSGLGWPFGISTYKAERLGGSCNPVQQEECVEKNAVCGIVPSPPLPPSPTDSWLGKAVTKNASKTSPLATLQQREKAALAREKLDFIAANLDGERRWENKVKESRGRVARLRFSEELHQQHHPSNRNPIKPLKL